mgnify:FL=1
MVKQQFASVSLSHFVLFNLPFTLVKSLELVSALEIKHRCVRTWLIMKKVVRLTYNTNGILCLLLCCHTSAVSASGSHEYIIYIYKYSLSINILFKLKVHKKLD